MLFYVPVLHMISVSFDSVRSTIDSSNLQASESIKPLRKVDILGSLRTTNVNPSAIEFVLIFVENKFGSCKLDESLIQKMVIINNVEIKFVLNI